MNAKDFIHQLKPPCSKCPYKLGLVQTLINPCPQCKANGYQTFERFQKYALVGDLTSKHENEQDVECN